MAANGASNPLAGQQLVDKNDKPLYVKIRDLGSGSFGMVQLAVNRHARAVATSARIWHVYSRSFRPYAARSRSMLAACPLCGKFEKHNCEMEPQASLRRLCSLHTQIISVRVQSDGAQLCVCFYIDSKSGLPMPAVAFLWQAALPLRLIPGGGTPRHWSFYQAKP